MNKLHPTILLIILLSMLGCSDDKGASKALQEIDYNTLNIKNPLCVIKDPAGKILDLNERVNGKLFIPKGSTIPGQCFGMKNKTI